MTETEKDFVFFLAILFSSLLVVFTYIETFHGDKLDSLDAWLFGDDDEAI